jgi:molecular chaperone DnaJ
MKSTKLSPTVRASYEFLGVDPGATQDVIKKAYHRLALLYHPDRNPDPNAAAEFRRVTEAFELVSDPPRVAEFNRRHLRERLHQPVIEGFEVTFGSFFGYRLFDPSSLGRTNLLRLRGRVDVTAEKQKRRGEDWAEPATPLEENNSILDNPAYDSIEVVYAGRFSVDDEERMMGEVETEKLVRLPWVVLNNQGIMRFLDGDLKGAIKCYEELCKRIPGNIIFEYRFGLCLVLDGFRRPRRTLLGALKPDRIKIEKGIALLRHCLHLGETRTVGRQKCLVIRKILADVLERTGEKRKAKALWREILSEDPRCAEAALKVKGLPEALRIAHAKAKPLKQEVGEATSPQRLGPGRD